MPTTPATSGSARPAAVINAQIRGLVEGGGLGSDEYLQLLVEWEAAVRSEGLRGDVTKAA
ncbi:hypothetical protein GCM10010331_48800 [Streptomyces xanthochromogenes]|uniref:hypothetical protein n=1 Tax=Streptomyces xanthochromogenes TaxID=67384 RepID=UPI00167AB1EB|nr:hypothetical protein [Streptomyces xanthochromogenes]GHB55228.1 hypothetical protein GCM10010331_48800 [Streptomyces xanthochromogenes]